MLPLSRFALLFNQKREFFIFGQNFAFTHSIAQNRTSNSTLSLTEEENKTKNYTSVQREEERRKRISQISDAMNLYIKSINEQEKFIEDEMIAFERGKRHLANIMGVDAETMTQVFFINNYWGKVYFDFIK